MINISCLIAQTNVQYYSMIMQACFPVKDFNRCLNEGQSLGSASLLAGTHNCSVFEVLLLSPGAPTRMAVKVYSKDCAPPPILAHLLGRPQKHLLTIFRILPGPPACVCMELCSQDLRGYLQSAPKQTVSPQEALRIAREIAAGLLGLKELRLMHGDLKPENILLDPQGVIKLGDLDFLLREEEFTKKRMRVGTLQYMAPEILASWACSYGSDIWSLGIVLFQLYFGRHPFPPLEELDSFHEGSITSAFTIIKDQLDRVRDHIKSCLRESLQPVPNVLLQVMLRCLVWCVSSRGDLEEVDGLLRGGQPRRKGSWSTDYSALHSEDDIFIFPNTGLLLAFEKLRTILSSLPEEAGKFTDVLQMIAGIGESGGEKERRSSGKEGLEALRSALGGKYRKMERNFKRLSSLEGGVGYSSKGELFIHLKYLLELLEDAVAEEGQQEWARDNCTRSAEFLS